MGRSRRESGDMGPGLDLVLSLFVVLVAGFSFLARDNVRVRQELTVNEEEFEGVVSALIREREVSQVQMDLVSSLGGQLEETRRLLGQARVAERALEELREKDRLRGVKIRRMDREAEKQAEELRSAQEALLRMEQRALEARVSELRVRRELLGLRGELRNLVFVVDTSKSMSTHGHWNWVKKILSDWLHYLSVHSAGVVFFSSEVTAFPEGSRLLPLDSSVREAFVSRLDEVQPGGATRTLEGLKRALEYDGVDTVILFTDGRPSGGTKAIFEFLEAELPDGVVINTVGLGDYYPPSSHASFLSDLATQTGGSFRGR